jgi:cAMP phosphodiesterase
MKIRVLGAFGGEGLGHRPSAFLVNEKILIDGGSVSGALTVDEQLKIEHAIVSHAHLDHIAGLVYLTETLAFCEIGAAVTIASIDPVITALRSGVFNDSLWPDFSRIPNPDAPVVKYRTLAEDVEQRVGDLWVTPVAVILECAFPNRLGPLGQVAKHMTPAMIRRELDKLPPDVPVWIFHVKPQFHAEIAEELSRLDGGRVSILEQDRIYSL